MKHFVAIVDKLDVEHALKVSAFLIFVFKSVELMLLIAVPLSRMGWGILSSAWGFGVVSNFIFQLSAALFQPMVLLALAKIIEIKKHAVGAKR